VLLLPLRLRLRTLELGEGDWSCTRARGCCSGGGSCAGGGACICCCCCCVGQRGGLLLKLQLLVLEVVEMRNALGAETPRRAKSGGRPNVLVLGDEEEDDGDTDPITCGGCFCLAQVVEDRRTSRGLARILGEGGLTRLGVDVDEAVLRLLYLTRLGLGGGGGGREPLLLSLQDARGLALGATAVAVNCCCQDAIHFSSSS
jgi:hypothetical protein